MFGVTGHININKYIANTNWFCNQQLLKEYLYGIINIIYSCYFFTYSLQLYRTKLYTETLWYFQAVGAYPVK